MSHYNVEWSWAGPLPLLWVILFCLFNVLPPPEFNSVNYLPVQPNQTCAGTGTVRTTRLSQDRDEPKRTFSLHLVFLPKNVIKTPKRTFVYESTSLRRQELEVLLVTNAP